MQKLQKSPSSLPVFFSKALIFVFLSASVIADAKEPYVSNVAGVSMTVSDLNRSIDFYTRVLTFKMISEGELYGSHYERLYGVFGMRAKKALLQLGEETVELVQYFTPQGRPIPADSRSHDLWFQHIAIIVRDMDAAYLILKENGVAYASSEPQTLPEWNNNAAGIKAFYFRDPDGHVLEILQFPPGKGDPKWARPGKELFMGVDHTAIAISDTEESLKFYRDLLGMRIVGESENHGIEQEHLNNVFGARLRITTLRANGGIAVELLEYLSPGDGRVFPQDTHSSDIWHWHTVMLTKEIPALDRALIKGKSGFISPGIIQFPHSKALMTRDPDGHAILFIDKEQQ